MHLISNMSLRVSIPNVRCCTRNENIHPRRRQLITSIGFIPSTLGTVYNPPSMFTAPRVFDEGKGNRLREPRRDNVMQDASGKQY